LNTEPDPRFLLLSCDAVKREAPSQPWVAQLAGFLSRAREDVQAVCANDPAARSALEVALLYPGLHALWLHRVAHAFWSRERPFSARLLSHLNRFFTGIEIHPGAAIGRRVVIDHGMGVVIGETATVGDDCLLYKGVVLGGTTTSKGRRHPQLGDRVVVGSNACILGAIEIGEGARVGSGSIVIKPVPAGATVVGVPARIIVPAHARFDAALDHANLPDPVTEMIRALAAQNYRLAKRVAELESKLGVTTDGAVESERLPLFGDELPPVHGG
jgi:serine O-acetyltransferase